MMKTVRVKTWNDRPAIAMSTPTLLLPDDEDDIAPPVAWRVSEMISQGMKIQ
jgi:hypothetical protein